MIPQKFMSILLKELSRFKVDNNKFDSKLIEIHNKMNFVNYISALCWKKESLS